MGFTWDLKAMKLKKVFLNSLMVFLLASQGAMAYAFYPKLSYDTQNNRYMVIYLKPGEYPRSQAVYGQLRKGNGTAYGPEFLVIPGVSGVVTAVAQDPDHGRFLVVSSDYSARILGQLVDTQGTTLGESIVIFQGTSYMEMGALCVTFDTAYQRFLVTWTYRNATGSDIYGQFVNADGSLYGEDFIIMGSPTMKSVYSIAYDSNNHRFLIVWGDGNEASNPQLYVHGLLLDSEGSTMVGDIFIGVSLCQGPGASATYDPVNQRYLVVWSGRSNCYVESDIFGQFIAADGSLHGGNVLICGDVSGQFAPSAAFDTTYQRFLVVWTHAPASTDTWDLYGQWLNANGVPAGTNFAVVKAPGMQTAADVAYNVRNANFLVAYDTDDDVLGNGYVVIPWSVKLLSPNGGDVIPAGSNYSIQWKAPAQAAAIRVKYSIDNGATWLTIADGLEDTREFDWQVPPPPKNQRNCLLKVAAFDLDGRNQASDRSDAPFTIEVVKLTDPNEGESFFSGDPFTITWTTYATERPVESVDLFLTKNGGVTWKLFDTLTGNPGTYVGTVPTVPVTKEYCKIKVILKDMDGIPVGHDASDLSFTIQP